MNLYEAVFVRKSVRDFKMEVLEEKTLNYIQGFLAQLKPYKSNIVYDIKIVDAQKEMGLWKGRFRVKAPYYLVFSSEVRQDYLINAGYLLHQAALYLTARGIGCCYQGAIHPTAQLKEKLPYEFVIALAFGKSTKSIYRPQTKAKRLDESSLVVYKEEVSQNIKNIIKAAILSPSSMNNQPWRFVVYRNRIHVFCKKTHFFTTAISDIKFIDMGIAISTIMCAADELWMDAEFGENDAVANKELKNTEYITTIVLKEKIL